MFIVHRADDKNLSILCRVIVQIVTERREHAEKFQKGSQGSSEHSDNIARSGETYKGSYSCAAFS